MISTQTKQFDIVKRTGKIPINEELNRNYLQCWQILERMINQNIFDEIALGLYNFLVILDERSNVHA